MFNGLHCIIVNLISGLFALLLIRPTQEVLNAGLPHRHMMLAVTLIIDLIWVSTVYIIAKKEMEAHKK